MEINIPEVTRTVIDYEFVFGSGMGLSVTVDPDAGDTTEYLDGIIHIHIAAKPSPTEFGKGQQAEDHTIFLRHVASSVKRDRVVVELSHEQKEVMKHIYKEASRSIH